MVTAALDPASDQAPRVGLEAPVIAVEGLSIEFANRSGAVRVVDDLSFTVGAGETVGLVGESGCGKSLTALAMMRLIPEPPGRIAAGRVLFGGRNLVGLGEPEMRRIRGNALAMIFQEPMTSLNPLMTIGRQIGEVLSLHRGLRKAAAGKRAVEMLDLVRIPNAKRRIHEYPHQLSGGMRQRVMIAMALVCDPGLLIADEPTTALDVTIQAQILALMQDVQERFGMAILLITHDLGVVAETCDRVIVMYAGRKVEEGTVRQLFENPLHPYTAGLLASVPVLGSSLKKENARLAEIPGVVPQLDGMPTGCRFAPRCHLAVARCRRETPPEEDAGRGHALACWRWREGSV